MSAAERAEQSDAICRNVLTVSAWQQANVVTGYMATEDEVDVMPLLAAASAEGKKIVVPAVIGREIVWRELTDVTSERELTRGVFRIREPVATCRAWYPHEETGAIVWLIPGVGFDRTGRRLGRGGGYYDRVLSQASLSHGVLGLGFTCQLIEVVPAEEHDWRMNWIITPEECIAVQGSNT